jgi:hypothetical protein
MGEAFDTYHPAATLVKGGGLEARRPELHAAAADFRM